MNDDKIGDGITEEPPSKKAKVNNDESKPASRDKSSRRMSKLAKVAQEGEALLKEMGHQDESAGERRRTRSQTRGTPQKPQEQPPAPASTKRGKRGRGKKDSETPAPTTPAENEASEEVKKGAEGDGLAAESKENATSGEEPVTNNTGEAGKEKDETEEKDPAEEKKETTNTSDEKTPDGDSKPEEESKN